MSLTVRSGRWQNSNAANILGHSFYLGCYHDRSGYDEGHLHDETDWIRVECPVIIDSETLQNAAAVRAARNPRRMAPHAAAGTSLLTGIARCGMAGCDSGMMIRSGKGGRCHYWTCNNRVNGPKTCTCPIIPWQRLDDVVLEVLERQLLTSERLEELLAGLLENSDGAIEHRRA